MNYLLYLYISGASTFNLGKKSILICAFNFIIKRLTKGIETLAKSLFSFSIIVLSMKLLVAFSIMKKRHLVRNMFSSPHTSNWIYFLHNCFSNYLYLKDMYITLKGIGKILFVSVLRILLICKFLNVTAAFTEKI